MIQGLQTQFSCGAHKAWLCLNSASADKLEAAMKGMVATVAKSLDDARHNLAARVADTFTILW